MKRMKFHAFRSLAFAVAIVVGGEGCHSHEHGHGHAHEPHDSAQSSHSAHATHGDHEEAHGGHDDEKGHGHGHGEDAIGITRWTDKLELFAEHSPAVTGQELAFLAHLTILDGFQALESATVTLVLDGPSRVEASVTEKLRSGIFRPTLSAPAAGTYRGSLRVSGPGIEDTIDGFEIVVHPSTGEASHASAHEDGGGPEPIAFLKEQQWQIPFATAFAAAGTVVPMIEVAGEVTTPPSGQADVGATITGRVVTTAKGLPRPGQSVRRGELLATLAPAPAAPEAGALADLAVVETAARFQAARSAVDRAVRLIADRAISQREVDEAIRELGVAEEAMNAARRARDVFAEAASAGGGGTYRLTAPIDGIVVEVKATSGKSVQVGEPLFRLVNLQELWIQARVPEQQAALIRADQDAAFKLPGLEAWLPLAITGDKGSASVIHVGRTVDRRSRTVDVIYALRAPDERLRVGSMLRVAVPAGHPWSGVMVPRAAVYDDDGRTIVYVQVEGEAFEERNVRVGAQSGTHVGIESGVSEGERVVLRGANVIRIASRASTTPSHGHVH